MKKTSVTIITEKQSAAIKNKTIIHTLSIIWDVVDVSNKLNKNLSVISSKSMAEWIGILSFLSCKFEYGAKFICMINVAYTNIQSKIKINVPLSDPFTLMQEVHHGCPLSLELYIMEAEVLANFIDADKRMKGVKIGDHEMKLVNFADDITIFLGDITCFNEIQLILKLYEEHSSSKINFSKSQAL